MGAALAKSRVLEPTRERRRHGRIERVSVQIPDARGEIGQPFRAEGLLALLERRGDISATQRQAGDEFARLFRLASLDPLRAADMGRVPIAGMVGSPHSSEHARRRINDALQALGGHGSPCGSCAWFIVGCELSIKDWAIREGWGGRALDERVAKGTLIGALGVLEAHFGLG